MVAVPVAAAAAGAAAGAQAATEVAAVTADCSADNDDSEVEIVSQRARALINNDIGGVKERLDAALSPLALDERIAVCKLREGHRRRIQHANDWRSHHISDLLATVADSLDIPADDPRRSGFIVWAGAAHFPSQQKGQRAAKTGTTANRLLAERSHTLLVVTVPEYFTSQHHPECLSATKRPPGAKSHRMRICGGDGCVLCE